MEHLENSQKYMSVLVFVGSERALGKTFSEIDASISKKLERL